MNANGNSTAIPATMLPGTVTKGELDGQPVVLVGTVPTGYTVILCPNGWATLQRWKLTTLRVARGGLYAAGKGRAGGFAAARFLLGISGNYAVRHRNGNPFDIRLRNIVAVSRGLIRQAAIETARGPGYTNPDVRWGDGRCHSGKPLTIPSARQRLADALMPTDPG
ncbi:HNH endonuclease [Bradyrhizobium sp. 63_E2_N1_3]|uniref:HNH endonuclease n=1 Tax=Bradyrhizobium sp. 63_E2_N1_3 TaxID=3240373 RepID=UPI003F889EA2